MSIFDVKFIRVIFVRGFDWDIEISGSYALKIIKYKAFMELFMCLSFCLGILWESFIGYKFSHQRPRDIHAHGTVLKFAFFIFLVYGALNMITFVAAVKKRSKWLSPEMIFKIVIFTMFSISLIFILFCLLVVGILIFFENIWKSLFYIGLFIGCFLLLIGSTTYFFWSMALFKKACGHITPDIYTVRILNNDFLSTDNIG
uniref:Uncharacterized protein n=1 Tax=Acrobeloides nanus TaxID=290746 RepID=A0A914CJH6_9BILA